MGALPGDIKNLKLRSFLNNLVRNDSRNFYERTKKKSPKSDVLFEVKDLLKEMLVELYSISDILEALNSKKGGFSVSDTTLKKFLNLYLADEYLLNQKMRYFYYKIFSIDKLYEKGFSEKEIFFELGFGKKGRINKHIKLDLSVEDFSFFFENYYSPELKNNGVKSYSELLFKTAKYLQKDSNDIKIEKQQKVVNTADFDVAIDKDVVIEQPDDKSYLIDDVIINECGLREKVVDFYKADLDKKGFRPDLSSYYAINHDEARDEAALSVRRKIEKPLGKINYEFRFFENCKFKNTYNPVNLGLLSFDEMKARETDLIKSYFDDRFEISNYKEFLTADFFDKYRDFKQINILDDGEYRQIDPLYRMGGLSIDNSTEKVLEKFIYFPDMFLLQISDLSTLGFVDGQVVIVRSKDYGYDLYRYFKGELHFIKRFDTAGKYSPSLPYYIERNFDMIASEKFKKIEEVGREYI